MYFCFDTHSWRFAALFCTEKLVTSWMSEKLNVVRLTACVCVCDFSTQWCTQMNTIMYAGDHQCRQNRRWKHFPTGQKHFQTPSPTIVNVHLLPLDWTVKELVLTAFFIWRFSRYQQTVLQNNWAKKNNSPCCAINKLCLFLQWLTFLTVFDSGCPDMTFAVDWALNNNYLSLTVVNFLFSESLHSSYHFEK